MQLVDDASETSTIVEVRAPDELGVLHRITAVLDDFGLDVRSAHISTLGADVVDAFYVPVLTDPAVRESLVEGPPRRPPLTPRSTRMNGIRMGARRARPHPCGFC